MLQMHLMLPLHFVYKMLESGKMHFGVHFPKENVQRTFSKGKCSAYIFQRKMFSKTKCYKCIFAYIFQRKMFSCAKMHLMRTFCFAKMHLMQKCIWCKNAFLRTFSFGKCSAYILRSKMFSINKMLQMHLMLPLHFVYKMLESGKMHFGVHFPKENVQRTFDFVKCSASHLTL